MANILVCTGKKRAVIRMAKHFQTMHARKTINILATVQRSKKALVFSYEEMKILFQSGQQVSLDIDKKLVRAVDFMQIRRPSGLVVKVSSFTVAQHDLKWSIIAHTSAFQLLGGRIDIREEIREEDSRELRTFHITMVGPTAQVISLKNLLVNKKVANPKTVEYVL